MSHLTSDSDTDRQAEQTVSKQEDEEEIRNAQEIANKIINTQALSANSNENLIVTNFVKFFEPLIQHLDSNVEALRLSQVDLTNQIKYLLNQISKIYEDEKKKLELDEYTKRLVLAKKRLNSVQAIIMSVQERLNRIYSFIQKDPLLQSKKS